MLYWTNVSGQSEWEDDVNWFTSDPGGSGNPNGATQLVSGDGTGPWTANDSTITQDLTLSSNEYGSPTIAQVQNITIGASDASWTITGTCDIDDVATVSGYNALIYDGQFTGAGFYVDVGYSAGIYGGTFSGDGMVLAGGYIYGGTFSGDGVSCTYPGINISGGNWYGDVTLSMEGYVGGGNFYGPFDVQYNGYVAGGTYYGSFTLGEGGALYAGTFSPSGTIAFGALIVDGVLQWGLTGTAQSDPGFVASGGGYYAPILTVTGIPTPSDILGTGLL